MMAATSCARVIGDTFDVWRVHSSVLVPGEMSLISAASDEASAREMGLLSSAHKAIFAVRRVNELTGVAMLSFYTVRQQSKPVYRRVPGMAHDVQVRPKYADHLFDLRIDGLAAKLEGQP